MARKSYRVKFAGGDSNVQLAGIVDRPDDGDPCPVVVFSHCFTCNKDLKSTVRVARAMSEIGIAVLRFDMMGAGGSEGDFSQSNFSTNLADLAAAIHFASSDLGPVTGLMGHSFGGAASLATAAGDRFSIDALITLAAPSDSGHLADLLEKMNPAIQTDGVGDVRIGGVKWTIRRQMLEDFRQHDLPKMISNVSCPTLLMHSPTDSTVGYDSRAANHDIAAIVTTASQPSQLADAPRRGPLVVRRDRHPVRRKFRCCVSASPLRSVALRIRSQGQRRTFGRGYPRSSVVLRVTTATDASDYSVRCG